MTGAWQGSRRKEKHVLLWGWGGPPKKSVASLFKVELQNSSKECQISVFDLIKYVLYLWTF